MKALANLRVNIAKSKSYRQMIRRLVSLPLKTGRVIFEKTKKRRGLSLEP